MPPSRSGSPPRRPSRIAVERVADVPPFLRVLRADDRAGALRRFVVEPCRDPMKLWWKAVPQRAPPAVAEGERIYAVGDLHGRLDLLDAMLDRIDSDLARLPTNAARLVFLGDYIDRGPDSAKVIGRLIEVAATFDAVFLKGNHEDLLCEFLSNPAVFAAWRNLGGLTTLLSFGITPPVRADAADAEALASHMRAIMPPKYRAFFTDLRLTWTSGDYIFVHAGIRPGVPLDQQVERDLLWIRQEFTRSTSPHEKFVVHGHTPVQVPEVRPNRINVDTGAYATGRLTCVVLDRDQRRFLMT